jgi:group I intron endonuclease
MIYLLGGIKMAFVIYCITNKLNKKKYVGQSIDYKKRWKDHISDAKRSKKGRGRSAIQNAIFKYGKENFTFKVIEECNDTNDLNDREEFYIAYLNTLAPNGYNLKTGGVAPSPSQETRDKISKTLKTTSSLIGKKGKDHPSFGRIPTAKQREKVSKANSGDNASVKVRKINSKIARKIYLDYLDHKLDATKLGSKYGLKQGAILNILNKKCWKDATKDLPAIQFSKGRNGRTALTKEQALFLRKEFKKKKYKSKSVWSYCRIWAEKYKVKPHSIYGVITRKSWKDI